ncbi:anthranilate synthase component I family protein [Bacillus sp. Marseille-P3661]|uniref:anthranilate synthase component I family protein n=1 Tax=Bacillus sp. Marseille-P3661 TaxID=1936234 RepID=UPI000C8378FE|nr:anthranilate synthase component I family protein [Bacillus sp. Marseille-P3661]
MKSRKCLAKKIPYSIEKWFDMYEDASRKYPHHALLESGRDGRYNILGLEPIAVIKGKDNEVIIEFDGNKEIHKGKPLIIMKEWMKYFKTEFVPEYPEFQGGAIGYISYDYVRCIEEIPSIAKDDLETPDLYFYVYDDLVVFDHHDSSLWLMTHYIDNQLADAEIKLKAFEQFWINQDGTHHKEYNANLNDLSRNDGQREVLFSKDRFIESVTKIQDYITDGDVFQVNLSVRQSEPLLTSAFEIYKKLREINPSPYMAYIQFPEFQIVSGSPELLIKKKGNKVSTRPIAGTRSRGANDEEDTKLAEELIQNEKEKAEHVMLVDLERNDLGRVCKFGTVQVNEFMVIERYSHVMHIVSNVIGEVDESKGPYEIIEAVFPGGTITGAPKVRTMEIIEELEPVRRGLYTGSIGWISFSEDMELNIAIRTMIVKDHMCHVQAGAGIVVDSNPKAEYNESLKKGKALWKAKELSEQCFNLDLTRKAFSK